MSELAQRVLDLPLPGNEADAATVREYLSAQLAALWYDGEGFSGKRPFGNSGWEWDIYIPLAKAGLIVGTFSEDGDLISLSDADGLRLVQLAIAELGRSA